jgi:hypothetical protein
MAEDLGGESKDDIQKPPAANQNHHTHGQKLGHDGQGHITYRRDRLEQRNHDTNDDARQQNRCR